MNQPKRNWQADLKVFRERMGGVTEQKKLWAKKQVEDLRAIRKTLKSGPHTVPRIADEVHLPPEQTMWYVMAMKRYGEVVEAGQDGSYFRYALKEASA